MPRYVSKNRTGVNRTATASTIRATNGRFARVYAGNYRNSSEMPRSERAQRFGNRNAQYRDIRAAFGLSAG